MIPALVERMAEDLAEPPPPGLEPLLEALHARFGEALRSVVLYGSCRRNSNLGEGLVDLMAVVSSYRAVHGIGPTAVFNRLLPPNVYYLEAGPQAKRVRCKYIIVSETTLARRTAGGLDAYFWARFAQPCRRVYAADEAAGAHVAECRAAAAATFAREASTLGDETLDARDFWIRAVSATYGCELRPEPPGSAAILIDRDPAFWREISEPLLPSIDGIRSTDHDRFQIALGGGTRFVGRMRWSLRRIWGKLLNVLRLIKAAGTFTNGIDYLVWKIERHSGVRVEPSERMRRWPRASGLVLLFRLWRSGAFK